MEQRDRLAALFRELAVLLELKGENPFKTRAYENAARTLEHLAQPLAEILAAPPKGFGKGLLDKVQEFATTGRLAEVETLRETIPPGVFDLLKVQGLGPKRVKFLFEECHICSLGELEEMCRDGSLAGQKGFGEKSVTGILAGIEAVKRFQGQFLLSEARRTSDELLSHLRAQLGDIPLEVAGSLRRCKETVKDIDLLAASDGGKAVREAFLSFPLIQQVLAEGDTKVSVRLATGIQVDLRIVAPDNWGPALCYFTGSKEYNTQLRGLALEKGLKLNEYGLYKNEKCAPMATEEEVFAGLGLPFIPPELREGLGEIELARDRRLPTLVAGHDLRGILHAHTTYSDGSATITQMAEAARALGFSWLGLADHSRSAHYAGGLSVERVREQWAEIDAWNAEQGDFLLLKGIESDILPDGSLDYPDEILAGFDFVIASVHSHFGMTGEEMTRRVLRAVENPFTKVLGHPTGRLLLAREGFAIDLDEVLSTCALCGTAVEINSHPQRLDLDWRRIRACRESCLMFSIDPDSHEPAGLSDFRYGVGVARKGGLSADRLLNAHGREEIRRILGRKRRKP